MTRLCIVGFTLACVLTLGCADHLRPELSIHTDANTYVVPQPQGGPFVSVWIRNESSRVMQLAACGGTDVLPLRQRLHDGEWVDDPIALCAAFKPKELAPGEVVSVGWWNFFSATGTYRFRAPLYRDSLSVQPSRETSPTFRVLE